jgi:hypothetical protein
MNHRYIIYTNLPRNFDPAVEGETLDSIVGSCEGIRLWSIPLIRNPTEIHLELSRPLEEEYIRSQLSTEFGEILNGEVVAKIEKLIP